jgi:hypothetical protein
LPRHRVGAVTSTAREGVTRHRHVRVVKIVRFLRLEQGRATAFGVKEDAGDEKAKKSSLLGRRRGGIVVSLHRSGNPRRLALGARGASARPRGEKNLSGSRFRRGGVSAASITLRLTLGTREGIGYKGKVSAARKKERITISRLRRGRGQKRKDLHSLAFEASGNRRRKGNPYALAFGARVG